MAIDVGLKTQPSSTETNSTWENIGPIRRQLYDDGPLDVRPVASPGLQTGEALAEAHRSGAEDSGGAGDGQGQAHRREGRDHVEDAVHQHRHGSSPFIVGVWPIQAPPPIWTVIR